MKKLPGFVALLAMLSLTTVVSAQEPSEAETGDLRYRGFYGSGASSTSPDLATELGFNLRYVPAPDIAELDRLASQGQKAIIWLGSYWENCTWEWDDDKIRRLIEPIDDHPAVAAYQLADEPGNEVELGCPTLDQYRARHQLVKSLDPDTPTYTTLASNHDYKPWATITDIIGLVVYPCNTVHGCQFGKIRTAVDKAEAAGIDRYWAVVQDFAQDGSDAWYRLPTAAEVKKQIEIWDMESRATAYVSFHWERGDIPENTAKQDMYRAINGQLPEPPPPPDAPRFDDIGDSIHADSIAAIAEMGITLGCNPPANSSFCPEDPVTRAEMATFLIRGVGGNLDAPDRFTDDDGSVHERTINAAADKGITTGCSENRFCPERSITRGEMAALLNRALDLPAGPRDADPFDDDDNSIFEDDIESLAHSEITHGCGHRSYCPTRRITRAEMASLLHRGLGDQ